MDRTATTPKPTSSANVRTTCLNGKASVRRAVISRPLVEARGVATRNERIAWLLLPDLNPRARLARAKNGDPAGLPNVPIK